MVVYKVYRLHSSPSSIFLSSSSGSSNLWTWRQPAHCPTVGKVSLPTHPRFKVVTNVFNAGSLSWHPINFIASLTLKPKTSPHLHLVFMVAFGMKKRLVWKPKAGKWSVTNIYKFSYERCFNIEKQNHKKTFNKLDLHYLWYLLIWGSLFTTIGVCSAVIGWFRYCL